VEVPLPLDATPVGESGSRSTMRPEEPKRTFRVFMATGEREGMGKGSEKPPHLVCQIRYSIGGWRDLLEVSRGAGYPLLEKAKGIRKRKNNSYRYGETTRKTTVATTTQKSGRLSGH